MLRSAWLVVCVVGCIDEPVQISPWQGGAPTSRLSELGLFAEPVAAQLPLAGVVSYDVIAPLWSDHAAKSRYIATRTPLGVTDDHWQITDGTYLVKTFWFPVDERAPELGRTLVETRVIAFHGDAVEQATYVWNAAQTDAISSGGNLDVALRWTDAGGVVRDHVHHVPGTSQCETCHGAGALGIRTPQLTAQLDHLVAVGVADGTPTAALAFVDPYADGPLEPRALSYLDSNCSHCHRPGGNAADTGVDWRREHASGNICREASFEGRRRVIDPGAPERSVVVARMRSADPFSHMPRGPSHIVDERGLAVIEDWIRSLPTGCP